MADKKLPDHVKAEADKMLAETLKKNFGAPAVNEAEHANFESGPVGQQLGFDAKRDVSAQVRWPTESRESVSQEHEQDHDDDIDR